MQSVFSFVYYKEKKWKYTNLSIITKSANTIPMIQIIGSEVFATSRSLQMSIFKTSTFKIVTLDPSNIRNCIFATDQWVFARCLLTSTPPWVPKHVNVWGPKCHSIGLALIINSPRLQSNCLINNH